MIFEYSDYRKYLKQVLANKVEKNKSFSLRSFAHQLQVTPALLSSVIRGKKNFSLERAKDVAGHLKLKKQESRYFQLLVELEKAKSIEYREEVLEKISGFRTLDDREVLELEKFRTISDWRHIAVLQLMDLTNFDFTVSVIRKRLRMKTVEVEQVLERLRTVNLIEKKAGSWRKLASRWHVGSEEAEVGLRNFHEQMLNKALQSLSDQTPQEKHIGSTTLAFDPELLPKVKQESRKFFERLEKISEESKQKTQVYHAGVQFFRLTEKT